MTPIDNSVASILTIYISGLSSVKYGDKIIITTTYNYKRSQEDRGLHIRSFMVSDMRTQDDRDARDSDHGDRYVRRPGDRSGGGHRQSGARLQDRSYRSRTDREEERRQYGGRRQEQEGRRRRGDRDHRYNHLVIYIVIQYHLLVTSSVS